jgi:hypothetical protein
MGHLDRHVIETNQSLEVFDAPQPGYIQNVSRRRQPNMPPATADGWPYKVGFLYYWLCVSAVEIAQPPLAEP